MIYFDNSATTFPKPANVNAAVAYALKKYGANPGRSGHMMSKESSGEIERCRNTLTNMFGAKSPNDIAFTLNCTHAINYVLKGLVKPGDHVVTSCIEHNAVMRPLKKLKDLGATYSVVKIFPGDNDRTIDSFRRAITAKTVLIACSHASNVWGVKLPIERLAALAKIYEIPILVDGAQSGGLVPIDVQKSGIDYLCLAGHKALYGPMGIGALIVSNSKKLDTIIEGGTGTNSMKLCQPEEMPQKFESGTPNTSGISGLRAGIDFINTKGIDNIFNHEISLTTYLYDNLKKISGAELYMPRPDPNYFVPVLSFNLKGYVSDEIGKILDNNKIEVRTGLHCSPTAHEFCGTIERGAVRASFSAFNTKVEVEKLLEVVSNIKKR